MRAARGEHHPSVFRQPFDEQFDQQEVSEAVGRKRGLVAFGAVGDRPIVLAAGVAQKGLEGVDFAPVEHRPKPGGGFPDRSQ